MTAPSIKISNPGEIQKEYQTELLKHVNEVQKDVDKELIQSSEFIVNLYKKEKEMLIKSSEDEKCQIKQQQQQPEEEDGKLTFMFTFVQFFFNGIFMFIFRRRCF